MPSIQERVLSAANAHSRMMMCMGCAGLAQPALALAYAWRHEELGVNPLETLIHDSGKWAFILLLGAMTLGPLRRGLMHVARLYQCSYGKRLSDWNWLLRLRRPCGVAAFLYGLAHFCLYAWLDLGLDWHAAVADLAKPFILVGFIALLFLLPLAITSTDGWVLRLKQRWKVLHMLVYPAAGLALMHVILLSKPGMLAPYVYGIVLMPLLGYRVLQRRAHGLPPQLSADASVPERSPDITSTVRM